LKQSSRKLANVNRKKDRGGSKLGQIERRLNTKLVALHKHASQLYFANNVDEIVKYTLDGIEFALGFDFADILLVEQGHLRIKGSRGMEVTFSELPLDGRGLTVKAARNKATIRISDTRGEPEYVDRLGFDWKKKPTMLSELAVPVILDGETAAVLNVESKRLNAFTEEDQRLLETLASHVASAVSRLQSQKSLRRSQAKTRGILDALPDLVFEVNSDGVFTGCHAATPSDLAYPPEKFLGKSVRSTLPLELANRIEAAMVTAKKTGIPQRVEYQLPKLSGEVADWEARIASTSTGNFLVIARNITERKRAEEAYRTVVQHALQGLAILQDSRIVFANQALLEMSGYSLEETLSLPPNDVLATVHPEDRERVWMGMQDLLAGKPVSLPQAFRLRRKDGTIRWVETLASRIEYRGKPAIQVAYADITERKQAEEELRQSEERYRLLFEKSPVGVGLSTADGTPISANKAMIEITGYSFEEMRKINLADTYVDPQALTKLWQILNRDGSVTNFRARLRRKDGTPYDAVLSISRLQVGGKDLVQTTCVDITRQKQMEEELRRRAQELDSLQKTLLEITGPHELPKLLNGIVERAAQLLGAPGGGLYLCDPEKQEARCVVAYNTKVNAVGLVLKYGEGAAGVVAQTGKPLIIDDYRTWPSRAAAFEKDRPFGAVLSAPMIWHGKVIGVIHVLDYEKGRCFTQADLGLLVLFANHAAIAVENQRHSEDLERMVAERTAKLAESEHQLRLMADSLPALISYVDSEQRYMFNNKAYEEWFGQPISEIFGRHVREVLGEPTYQRTRPRIEAALSGKTQSYEYELPHRSKGTRYVRVQYVPDFGEHGQVKGMFVLASDITERKQMEERLLRAERLAAIGETAAMVGHDLRNPLQAISSATYFLKKKLAPVGDEKTREMLEAVENSVAHSDKIVNDLLEYSEDIRLELSETTPKSITRDALLDVKIPQNISVSDMASYEPKMRVDTAKIKRVFINLIENAVDSMPNGGKLTITSNKSNNYVELMFTDTGVGIPQQVLRGLWKPLITTKPKGIGLGLAICKRIAEAHGGSIIVDSKEGKGTTFTLTLPLTSQEGAKTP
jgi:PAS domain S-box-containing protein